MEVKGMKGLVRALVALAGLAGVLLLGALPTGTASAATPVNDTCSYPSSSFTESTVMRWAQVNGQGSSAQIVGFANDEKGLLLGVNGATPLASAPVNGTNSHHASNASGGDPSLKDPSNRPFYPALYISDVTNNPNATTGQYDFQNGGSPVNLKAGQPFIDDVFGAWSTAQITNGNYTVTPPPAQNHWTLGTGSDQPVGTTFAAMGDEGYGAEVRWNVSELKDGAGNPLLPGHIYRIQILTHDGDQNKAGGDAGEFCVTLKAPGLPTPTIVTHATSGNVGDTITDSATVSGGAGNPTPTGSVTFNAYSDASCTNLVYTDTKSLNGGQATAAGFKPSTAGTYYWVDTYSGDANYAAAGPYPGAAGTTACSSDPLEKSTVDQRQPSISTSATSGLIGNSVQDTATVSNGSNPTGTVSFTLYSDASCHTAVFTDTETLNNNGQAVSKSFTPSSAGNYYWIANYSGDTNNKSASGTCGDQGETSTITPKQPAISTSATSGLIGDSVQDTATVSGGVNPTGTVSFTLYSDASCKTAVFTDTETLGNNGQAVSKSFTPSSVGNYYWIASYSGDTNNKAVSGSCGDQGETSTIEKRVPTLTTNAVAAANGKIHDTATLTGGFNPTGKITWNVYDQTNDPTCTTPLNNSTLSATVTGDGTFPSPDFAVSNADNYVWVATYSGDANNVTLTTACNDPNEVSPGTPNNPAIKLIKLEQVNSTSANGYVHGPVHGFASDTVDYQMTVINTGNTDLVINFTDQQCDFGTLSGPSVISGTYNAGTQTLSSGGELQYTCSHVLASSDPSPFVNTANVVGTVPGTNQTVSDHDSVDALIDVPGIKVVKLQRDGTSGAFTPNDITASVGDTIYYEIQATNTGNVKLTLSLTDPHCDSGTIQGPFEVSGTLNGDVLSPGGVAQYTCWHVVSADDIPTYTNVGTITGTPPSGPPVHGHGIVVAHITQAGIQAVKLASAPCADVSTTASQPSGILPCNGNYSEFTTGIITLTVPRTGSYSIPVKYQIRVTNTGNTPLALSLNDPLCNPGSIQGPTLVSGTLNGTTLSAGGQAFYTCTHNLTENDGNTGTTGQPFTNTATVTGTPPSGPPVHTTTIVTVHRVPPPQAVCIAKRGPNKGKKIHYTGKHLPKVCRVPHHHKPPKPHKPKHPHGFTG
jgi:plastocyanin